MIKSVMKSTLVLFFLLGVNLGCSSDRDDRPKQGTTAGNGMKCGAGKCGANMFDSNAALSKKKANIVKQMQEGDPRRDCVINATTTKEVYNCVRDPETGKLSKSFSTNTSKESSMKCGVGKCGASMKKPEPKKEPAMKCAAGKCGSTKNLE